MDVCWSSMAAVVGIALFAADAGAADPRKVCPPESTAHADVAAIDTPMVFNRLGAQNVNWQIYALWDDLVRADRGTWSARGGALPAIDEVLEPSANASKAPFASLSGKVALRPDLRPRPLTLRVAAQSCLHVRFVNLLTTVSNPYNATDTAPMPGHPMDHRSHDGATNIDDQVASRVAGFHPQGLELIRDMSDDSSFVGNNENSMPAPGELREYWFFAPHEGAFLISNPGAVFGGEGTAGTAGTGLFGAVAVQPLEARAYRGQVTEEELRAARRPGTTPQGHPVVDYEATYPDDCASGGPWCASGKVGRPILAMLDKNRRVAHGDINAIIVGPNEDGSFPPSTYPLESKGQRNPTLPNRLEPFREFVSVFHDENAAAQAFPGLFEHSSDVLEDNPLSHTLHGVRDAFMINYGSGGVGAEVVANRLGVGPMHDCVDCAFEEFFLSSFTIGDPALLVDKPANFGLEGVQPGTVSGTPETDMAVVGLPPGFKPPPGTQGPKASRAFYPHDPANVHHSYIGDFVKFRNVHVGKEQHIFHLHNHQWLYNPNDDNSNYIDAQAIGPGSGYSYEIAFGGSGNRNRSAGDAVFHCHFYPHFAQGMWYLWRIHDTFEGGTPLAVSAAKGKRRPYDLADGLPAKGARALPDGEIVSGTPIPAIVPLPGKALAPMPGAVEVVANPRTSIHNGRPIGSLARVEKVPDPTRPESDWRPKANPGYPFWIAGIEHSVGSRPTTPPLDMAAAAGGHDGGLPRHAVEGYSAHGESENTFHRLSAAKHEVKVKPVFFPEGGTGVERYVMDFHAAAEHATSAVLPDGTVHPTVFRTNGAPQTPGAPFFDPCIDDRQQPLSKARDGLFFNGVADARPMIARQQPGDPSGLPLLGTFGGSAFDAATPRLYKGANVQLDVRFNKLGDHFGQQRILALWEDVGDLLNQAKPPEPLVLRMNTFDCARYLHTNLVPKEYLVDDYQITTPTDVIGQHIHLPKWDLPSADGSANGWNYEDGTFSPAMVRARMKAINAWNAQAPALGLAPVPLPGGASSLAPVVHPFFSGSRFGSINLQLPDEECRASWLAAESAHTLPSWEQSLGLPRKCDWLGARTTIQRWFSDPVINAGHRHRGLGITFTHDHLGPSTHQQVGLYATMLTEPPNAVWRHNETGDELYHGPGRSDGGPTSWQTVVTGCAKHVGGDPRQPCSDYGPLAIDRHLGGEHARAEDTHREFFLQFGDFQHAYRKDAHFGVDVDGLPKLPTPDSFRLAVNPSVRKPANLNFPDIAHFETECPGSTPKHPILRPCPEVISADDIGMMVVNYRNEPVAARVYNPERRSMTDLKKGTQAAFEAGDLTHAYQSRTDRHLLEFNGIGGEQRDRVTKAIVPGSQPVYPADVNAQRLPGDPFTPMLRAYSGDLVRIKIQAGSHEHEHNSTIHGLKWMQGGSGYGLSPRSGWRNAQNAGLSEQFTYTSSIVDYEPSNHKHLTDRLWAIDTSQDGLWNGVWGVVRSYSRLDQPGDPEPIVEPLVELPQNPVPTLLSTKVFDPEIGYTNDCGVGDGKARFIRSYVVFALLANRALDNPLGAAVHGPLWRTGLQPAGGTLTYNPRATEITLQVRDDNGNLLRTERYGVGPLHDPTAILLAREEDVDPTTGKFLPGVPVEPIVLRANAGDCVRVLLKNLLPFERYHSPMPDLNGYTMLSHTVTRNAGSGSSPMTGFNNNLIRPSHHIALHPQLVHYDASVFDGSLTGLNIDRLVPPGGSWLYQWYAGDLFIPGEQLAACTRDDPRAEASLADINDLRRRVAGERLRRPSVDLNTHFSLANRLLALLDQPADDERRNMDRWQSGPPLRPDGQPSQIVPAPRPTAERPALVLKKVKPETGGLLVRPAESVVALEAFEGLEPTLEALLLRPEVQQCVDDGELDVPPGAAATARRTERAEFVREAGNAAEPIGVPDGAPALPFDQVYNRITRSTLAAARTRPTREVCAERVGPGAIEVLRSNEQLRRIYGTERLDQIARDWAQSFAYLVPGLDRDAFAPGDVSPAAFAWWERRYLELSPATTRIVRFDKNCRFEPIEFGASNLTPPDRIKQGQKGAVGAMLVLPPRSLTFELDEDDTHDRQNPGAALPRRTRATATVLTWHGTGVGLEALGGFRDFAAVHQKGLNLRYAKALPDGDPMGAVASLSAERAGDEDDIRRVAPEDAHDSGQMAINYGTEPMWFRFGIGPDAPFGHGGKPGQPIGEGLGGTHFAWQAFSSGCCSTDADQPSITAMAPVGEPAVPVFPMLHAGGQSRLRVVLPTGVGRGTTTHLHGHGWRRDPHLQGPGGVPGQCIGANPRPMWLGGQDSITPMAHFDLVFDRTGGTFRVPGDFVFRDQAGFGITSGLWGIVRNVQAQDRDFSDTLVGQPLKTVCQ